MQVVELDAQVVHLLLVLVLLHPVELHLQVLLAPRFRFVHQAGKRQVPAEVAMLLQLVSIHRGVKEKAGVDEDFACTWLV